MWRPRIGRCESGWVNSSSDKKFSTTRTFTATRRTWRPGVAAQSCSSTRPVQKVSLPLGWAVPSREQAVGHSLSCAEHTGTTTAHCGPLQSPQALPPGRANLRCCDANQTTDNNSAPSSFPRYNPRTPRLPGTRDTANASLPSLGTYSSRLLPGSGCPLIIRDEFLPRGKLCNSVYCMTVYALVSYVVM